MILLSTAMQWKLDSPTQLTVLQPCNLYVAIPMLVIAALGTLFLAFLAFAMKNSKPSFALIIFLMPFIAFFYFDAYSTYTENGAAVLSETRNTLTMKHKGKTDTYPLQSVQQAVVQTGDGGSLRMVFVMNDGQVVPMGDGSWSPRGGAYAAANAVNSFLLSGSMESTPTTPSASAPEDPDWQKEMKKKSDLQEKDYQERLRKEQAAKE
ncbi:MAG: hypothetical protein ABR907_15880 [Terracidiphilus sp.]|jgi:hypothetical protein